MTKKRKKPIESVASPAVRGMGRPTDFTQEKADLICGLISDGHSLRTVCALEGMPNMVTIFRWLREKPDFCNQYETSKQEQADAMQEDIIAIADEDPQLISAGEANGGAVVKIDAAFEQWRKTRIDARKWCAAKLKPKKYGDKLELDAKVSIGDAVSERLMRATKRA